DPPGFDAPDRDEAERLQAFNPALDGGLVDRPGTVQGPDELRVGTPGPQREQGDRPRTDEPEAGEPVRGQDHRPATEATVSVKASETNQGIAPTNLPAQSDIAQVA